MQKKLRVHHFLCIPLFRGEGYSDAFSENMARQIGWLNISGEEKIILVCEPDMICAKCPNLTEENTCRCSDDQVAGKDRIIAEQLELKTGELYTYQELCILFRKRLTKNVFEQSCCKCEWYGKGLCSYELWKNVK